MRRALPLAALLATLALGASAQIVSLDAPQIAQIIQPGPCPTCVIKPGEGTTLLGVQNQDAVKITGGTIDGVTIGGVVAAPGTFTTLNAFSIVFSSASILGNVTVGGTLGVTGATTLGALTAGATTATSLALGTPCGVASGCTGVATSGAGTLLAGTGAASAGFTASPTVSGTFTAGALTTVGAVTGGSGVFGSLSVSGALSLSSLTLSTPLGPASGGLGFNAASTPAGSVLAFSSTGVITPTSALVAGQVLIGQGAAALPAPKSLYGDSTMDATGRMVNTAVNGVAYPTAPLGVNVVPVLTQNDKTHPATVAYGTVPNAALANAPTLTYKCNPGSAPAPPSDCSSSPIANALTSDVALSNTGLFFDGPIVAQGTAGTWQVSGTVTVLDTAGIAVFTAKLWDGTSAPIASTVGVTSGANNQVSIPLSGISVSPKGSLRISVKDITATTGKIVFNASGLSADSTVSAVRVQ